jgi:hypothetical protein
MSKTKYCAITKKVIFKSTGKAEAALRSLRAKMGYTGRVYLCPWCHFFHLGRASKKTNNKYSKEANNK